MYQYSCDGTLGVLQAQYSYYYKAKVFFPENVFQVCTSDLSEVSEN